MTSLVLIPQSNSPNDSNIICTEAQVHSEKTSNQNDQEDIPYHARDYAKPFTYGNLPEGFKTSELNHVETEDVGIKKSASKNSVAHKSSPSTIRKHNRPSISPSRPVLRKTPSRQEFEEMLMERREQSAREQNNLATKIAQNAAIQKDLDELHEKLNKRVNFRQSCGEPKTEEKAHVECKTLETIDLPEDETCAQNSGNEIVAAEETESPSQRPETPAFPSEPKITDERCVSPYPLITSGSSKAPIPATTPPPNGSLLPNSRYNTVIEPLEIEPHLVKFAKDSSEFWYKPHITREEAVALLRNAEPGTFLIRSSTTYQNAHGLVLRVSKPPPGVTVHKGSNNEELVRHFLIESSTRGVRLKGCANEPLFTSLSAFVYEHSINQLALPCTLKIPDKDILQSSGDDELIAAQKRLLRQGAACNVLYLFTYNTESLTGDEAVRKSVYEMYSKRPLPKPVEVHFKVSQEGITLTDNTRTKFFRRHYTAKNISHFGIDPDNRFWSLIACDEDLERVVNKTIFAFVARPIANGRDNECHIFCDLSINQPASAIVSFVKKVLPLDIAGHKML